VLAVFVALKDDVERIRTGAVRSAAMVDATDHARRRGAALPG